MCGIAGLIRNRNYHTEAYDVSSVLESLYHRGPDAKGHSKYLIKNIEVIFFHTRLAIIDLDERSNQPFKDNNLELIFNGEIYNFIHLRNELEELGMSFVTKSDTEVIAKSYLLWGTNCFKRFEGMWALSILDKRNNTLVISRDRFGEKPLYVYQDKGLLSFSSEINTLREISNLKVSFNENKIKEYLVNGYKSINNDRKTFINNIKEFSKSSYEVIKLDNNMELVERKKYWKLEYKPEKISKEDAIEKAKDLLINSLKIRLESDVPMAFCLSGGIDSSIITSIAVKELKKEITTFSLIDSDERYDESNEINKIVRDLNCNSHMVSTTKNNFLENLISQNKGRSCPVATISYYIHNFLSREMKKNGFKVAISGTGADELFTGYYDHYNYWLSLFKNDKNIEDLLMEWKKGYGSFVRNPVLKNPKCFFENKSRLDHVFLNREMFQDFLYEPITIDKNFIEEGGDILRERMLKELFYETVPVMLSEDDSNSMINSIENRSPFLDSSLAKFLFTIPSKLMISNGYAKSILRDIGKNIIHEDIRTLKFKKGFNASINSLLDKKSNKVKERILSSGPIFDIVKKHKVEEMLKGDLESNSMSKFMFSFLSCKFFMESYT